MAQTQTVKKPNIFLQILKSLISNQTAIDSSEDRPWWVALIIAVLSVILAAVPVFVSVVTINGSDYFKSYSYDMDTNLVYFADKLGENKIKVKDHILTYEGVTSLEGDMVDPYEMKISEPNVIGFRAIYWNLNYAEIAKAETYNFDYYLKTFLKRGAAGSEEGTNYLPNFLFFYKDGFRVVIGTQATDTCIVLDSYNSFNLKDIADTDDFVGTWIKGPSANYMTNFKSLLTQAYKSTKTEAVLRQTGIYLGVYAGAILLLGLMVFLMTRGKRNPFNFMTFNDSLKISSWASLAPAVLALIFGFLMSSSSLGTIFFVLIHGLRIMWLSMNQLRPQY